MSAAESQPEGAFHRREAAEIQGLVDAMTDIGIGGWVRNLARPGERLAVELRLGDAVLGRTIADRDRPDLAPAGIGDGRHAFQLDLTPEWASRQMELSVVAIAADGKESVLPMRVQRPDPHPGGNLQRLVAATAAAHQEILDQIRATAERAEAIDAERQQMAARLHAQVETLTFWLVRLDERLAAMPTAAAETRHRRRIDPWQWVMAGCLGLAFVCAILWASFLVVS